MVSYSKSPQSYLAGSVHSQSGKKLSDAIVCIFCADCEKVDENGQYVLDGFNPGEYQVSVTAEEHRPKIINEGKPLLLGKRKEVLDDAELEEGGAQVSGVVVDTTGGPVIGATVQANLASEELETGRLLSSATYSDDTGSFVLSLSEGPVTLVASAEGYATARVSCFAPARGVRLAITPSSQISGSVVSSVDGSPVQGLRVTAHQDSWGQSAISDRQGYFGSMDCSRASTIWMLPVMGGSEDTLEQLRSISANL